MTDAITPPAGGVAKVEPAEPAEAGGSAARAALTLGALGVVFGDIGTSPLYAMQTVFSINHGTLAILTALPLERTITMGSTVEL